MAELKDILPEHTAGPFTEHALTFHDGSTRRVCVTQIETPFPSGELIVSQTTPNGIIIMCNDAFVKMSGYTADELLGVPHHILRHPDMPRAAFLDLWQTVQHGEKWRGYVKNLCKDGGHYWVYATIVPNVRGGKIVSYTSVRREPSRSKIAEMTQTYRAMLETERAAVPA